MMLSDQLKYLGENAETDEDVVRKAYTNSGSDTLVDSTVQQYVVDNKDVNIMSWNGSTSFHAKMVIGITSPAPVNRHEDLDRVPRKVLPFLRKQLFSRQQM